MYFFAEYIDYHLSPEPPVTTSPNLPRILAPVNPLNVTAQLGSPVSLHCIVRNLQDKTVRYIQNLMHTNIRPLNPHFSPPKNSCIAKNCQIRQIFLS